MLMGCMFEAVGLFADFIISDQLQTYLVPPLLYQDVHDVSGSLTKLQNHDAQDRTLS